MDDGAPIGSVRLTPTQRRWTRFVQVSGLREVLFFLDSSVPLTRGRLRRCTAPACPAGDRVTHAPEGTWATRSRFPVPRFEPARGGGAGPLSGTHPELARG